MADPLQIVTSQSWISRIFDSIGGFFLGLLLVPVSVVVLFWNEGHFVETYKSLLEGQSLVIDAPSSEITTANEGKLVHIIGDIDVGEGVTDNDLGISAKALRLKRVVKVFQWQEHAKSQTEKVLGGSEKTVTTYTYDQAWNENLISTSEFKDKAGHENPTQIDYENLVFDATAVHIGAFILQPNQIANLKAFTPLPIAEMPTDTAWPEEAGLVHGEIYIGANSQSPQIGDVRISFEVVNGEKVSVVAKQSGQSFTPFETRSGGSIDFVEIGSHTSTEMFASAQNDNRMFTWVLRLVGILIAIAGFMLLFKPISTIADVIPLLGSLVGFASGGIAILLGVSLSAASIGIAWVFFRPLIGGALLALAIGSIFAVVKLRSRKAVAL